MKEQDPSENLGGEGLLTPKAPSPFALQSIFFAWSISEHPPFTGNIPSPGGFHVQAAGEGIGVERQPEVVDPIHS
jgi:hypothetical protein